MEGRGHAARVVRLCAALALAVAAWGAAAPTAAAAPGAKVADLAVTEGQGGVSVAFDGRFLYYTALDGLTLHRVGTDGVTGKASTPIVGAAGINALTYDVTKDRFWAVDATGLSFYLLDKAGNARLQFAITPVTHLPGLCGAPLGCSRVVSGLAYDAATDTLWYTPQGSQRIYQFTTVGDLLGYVDVGFGLDCTTSGATGVAAGAATLYVSAGSCGKYFRYAKDDATGTATKTAAVAATLGTAADVECDDRTFSVDVLWVRDSVAGNLRAIEIEAGTCVFGGGMELKNAPRMTGGGVVPTFGGEAEIHHGYLLHCSAAIQPNNFQITFKADLDGDGKLENHRFHMAYLFESACHENIEVPLDPSNPLAIAYGNAIEGRGLGRLDGEPCKVNAYGKPTPDSSCAIVSFYLIDAGEPGSETPGPGGPTASNGQEYGPDRLRYLFVDRPVGENETAAAVVACECLVGGNYQFHPVTT